MKAHGGVEVQHRTVRRRQMEFGQLHIQVLYFWGKEPLLPLTSRLSLWQNRRDRWNQTTIPPAF